MPRFRGVDVSDSQLSGCPWPAWAVDFMYARVCIGYRMDRQYPRHHQEAHAAGVRRIGGYIYLLGSSSDGTDVFVYDGAEQAHIFISLLVPGLITVAIADLESPGLAEPVVRAFCDYWDRHGPLPLKLYGSQSTIDRILGPHPERYSRYGAIISGYGPMLPNATEPPVGPWPALPGLWAHLRPNQYVWQAAGDNGIKPPYPHAVDLDFFDGTEAELDSFWNVTEPAYVASGNKFIVGQVQNGDGMQHVHRAFDEAAPLVGMFGMDNAGLAIDARPLVRYTLTRIVQAATDAAPGMDNNPSDDTLRAMAAAQVRPYTHLGVTEKAAATYILPWNEPRPAGEPGYLALTRLMQFTADACEAEGFHFLAYAFNAGTPEYDEFGAILKTSIMARLNAGRHGVALHAGLLGASPADRLDDSILGASLRNPITGFVSPHLDDADPLVLRHRFFKRAGDELGIELAPVFITEFYPCKGAIASYPVEEIVRRYAWLDAQLANDYYVQGVAPYAIGSSGVGMPAADHRLVWPGLVDLAVSVAGRPNARPKESKVDEQTRLKVVGLAAQARDASQAIIDALPAPAPVPAPGPAVLYQAKVLQGVKVRDAAGVDTGRVLTVGTQVDVYAEHIAAGVYQDRARINADGSNVVMSNSGQPTLQRI